MHRKCPCRRNVQVEKPLRKHSLTDLQGCIYILSKVLIFSSMFVRGKKRKGLTAYRHTWIDDTDGYLIENLDKRWRLPAVDIVSSVQDVPEDEIQEVTVEMGNENPKPSGKLAKLSACIAKCMTTINKIYITLLYLQINAQQN